MFDLTELSHLRHDLAIAPAKVETAAGRVVDDWVDNTERDAKSLAPVFTGELKSRIHGRKVGLAGEVVSEAAHSIYVEEGTSDTAPQPFMAPAFERNVPPVEDGLGDVGEGIL